MKPAPFDYVRAQSADEAVSILAEYGDDARILAGGQSLMPMLNMRLAQPRVLIDISRTESLNYVKANAKELAIGAAVSQASVERHPAIAADAPLLHSALPWVAHAQIRNRGTLCGSIAHADPSAELPLCLLALGGNVVLRSVRGKRVIRAEDFFTGTLRTARQPDELIEEVRIPPRDRISRYGFTEASMRHGDFAIVAIALVTNDAMLRVAVGGVSDRPVARQWPRIGGKDLDDALNEFAWALDAQDDQHASAAYRRHLVRKLGRRLIQETGDAMVR